MYFSRLLNRVRPTRQARLITNYPTLRDAKPDGKPMVAKGAAAKAEQPLKNLNANVGREWTALSDWDKRILVLTRVYKSTRDIPEKIKFVEMERARSDFRRRIGIFFGICTLFFFYLTVKAGKTKSRQGDILLNRNLETHGKKAAE